ncbi:hypothetical protein RIVERRIDER_93 [Xanthomonas phage RiverRider]|uniref:Uncharacterized protein n=1 Tax=Xanthomonas phage RiverRider TaxID=2108116 RepID=A0A2P1JV29_9CAUD|nr:hypothetical protein HWB58_gp42 [Xanthomonas phage RiverRider]AVO23174.1 hypothetical protein RIVERRIDER_93 [Xanthomonas phage RiverRider]
MSNAPKVTIEEIHASIKKESYTLLPDGKTTICQLTMDNDFTIEGSSACVSIKNYDQAKGEKYAKERAINNCWQFLGWRLADKLKLEQGSFLTRLTHERNGLAGRFHNLSLFFQSPLFKQLNTDQQMLLNAQASVMKSYLAILDKRLELIGELE